MTADSSERNFCQCGHGRSQHGAGDSPRCLIGHCECHYFVLVVKPSREIMSDTPREPPGDARRLLVEKARDVVRIYNEVIEFFDCSDDAPIAPHFSGLNNEDYGLLENAMAELEAALSPEAVPSAPAGLRARAEALLAKTTQPELWHACEEEDDGRPLVCLYADDEHAGPVIWRDGMKAVTLTEADAEFIAAAPQLVRDLLAALQSAEDTP